MLNIKHARSNYLGSLKKLNEIEKSQNSSYNSQNSPTNMSIDTNISHLSNESEKLYRNYHSNPNRLGQTDQSSCSNILWLRVTKFKIGLSNRPWPVKIL